MTSYGAGFSVSNKVPAARVPEHAQSSLKEIDMRQGESNIDKTMLQNTDRWVSFYLCNIDILKVVTLHVWANSDASLGDLFISIYRPTSAVCYLPHRGPRWPTDSRGTFCFQHVSKVSVHVYTALADTAIDSTVTYRNRSQLQVGGWSSSVCFFSVHHEQLELILLWNSWLFWDKGLWYDTIIYTAAQHAQVTGETENGEAPSAWIISSIVRKLIWWLFTYQLFWSQYSLPCFLISAAI